MLLMSIAAKVVGTYNARTHGRARALAMGRCFSTTAPPRGACIRASPAACECANLERNTHTSDEYQIVKIRMKAFI
jgi:hypothetical protein